MLIPLIITALFVGLFLGRVVVWWHQKLCAGPRRKLRVSAPRLIARNPRLVTRAA